MLENTQWKEDYIIGNDTIDTQHKYLFEIAKRVMKLEKSASVKVELKSIVLDFNNYMKQHFSYEESFMKEINYPEIKQHIKLHKKFIDDTYDIITKPLKLHDIKQRVEDIIQNFINHIIHNDILIQKWNEEHFSKITSIELSNVTYK